MSQSIQQHHLPMCFQLTKSHATEHCFFQPLEHPTHGPAAQPRRHSWAYPRFGKPKWTTAERCPQAEKPSIPNDAGQQDLAWDSQRRAG
ncbi:hypothetical protein DL89DRAFT_269063 [Linderina pennispora]|uniref:Uncharacterized protein n=1 Tax=Linderina pennispora TaxID=61395 RepID=A0A1Y1W3X3_9FUNG|nr:uncharacterized protein DL89DRAFT_269063 [Linderina pennispora]ORX67874.1 hypothetical protein DL89DRAFT_269063 [Linderina pennispora]